MAGLLLLLALCFKLLSASFIGLIEGLGPTVKWGIIGLVVLLILSLIQDASVEAREGSLGSTIGIIIVVALLFGGLIAVIFEVGVAIVIAIANFFTWLIYGIASFFNWLSNKIILGFNHFVNVLLGRTGEL